MSLDISVHLLIHSDENVCRKVKYSWEMYSSSQNYANSRHCRVFINPMNKVPNLLSFLN